MPDGGCGDDQGPPGIAGEPHRRHALTPALPDQAPYLNQAAAVGIPVFYLAKGRHAALMTREEENKVPDFATSL